MTVELGQRLGQSLGQHLGQDLCPWDVKARFADATFTNASDRYLDYGGRMTSHDGGDLATRRIGGRLFSQIELAVENALIRSQEFGLNWTPTNTTVTDNDTTDPLGTSTADKLVEDVTVNLSHQLRQSKAVDGASQYCFSAYVKADERSFVQFAIINGFPANVTAYYNLTTGAVGTTGGGEDDTGIEDAGGGWYRCWITATSNAVVAAQFRIYLAEADNDRVYSGDGTSGVHLWGAQMELGTYPTSPIKTEAAAVTRAKDQLYWAEADVPAALRGTFSVDFIPFFSDTSATSLHYICTFKDTTMQIRIYYWASQKKFRVYNGTGSVALVDTGAITFSRMQKMKLTFNPAAGSLKLENASTGNGTFTDTAWSTSDGDVNWAANQTMLYQPNGLISEPY